MRAGCWPAGSAAGAVAGASWHRRQQQQQSSRAFAAADRGRAGRAAHAPEMSPARLAEALLRADRRVLSQLITLSESVRQDHQHLGWMYTVQMEEVLSELAAMPQAQPPGSFCTAITGPPGVGKSTLIEGLGRAWLEHDQHVAVLAVDPSSHFSGGSVLGDKVRMAALSQHPQAYVRPSPSRGVLGGLAASTCEAVTLVQAAGFQQVVLETVGVGQSEIAAAALADCVVLVQPTQGGDEMQMMKMGLMEVPHIVVVNGRGANTPSLQAEVRSTVQTLQSTLALRSSHRAHRDIKVVGCNALSQEGIEELRLQIQTCYQSLAASGELQQRRAEQRLAAARMRFETALLQTARESILVQEFIADAEPAIASGRLPARRAAGQALAAFLNGHR